MGKITKYVFLLGAFPSAVFFMSGCKSTPNGTAACGASSHSGAESVKSLALPPEPIPLKGAGIKSENPIPEPKVKRQVWEIKDKNSVNTIEMPSEKTSRLLKSSSFVTRWRFLGPFPLAVKEEKGIRDALSEAFIKNEQDLSVNAPVPSGMKWQAYDFFFSGQMGRIDYGMVYRLAKPGAYYAIAEIDSPENFENLTLHIGSGCYVKIWINSKLMFSYDRAPRKGDIDQDLVRGVNLKKGLNTVLVKCVDTSLEDRSFYLRFATEADVPFELKEN